MYIRFFQKKLIRKGGTLSLFWSKNAEEENSKNDMCSYLCLFVLGNTCLHCARNKDLIELKMIVIGHTGTYLRLGAFVFPLIFKKLLEKPVLLCDLCMVRSVR